MLEERETVITAFKLSGRAVAKLESMGYHVVEYWKTGKCSKALAVLVSPAVDWTIVRRLLECSGARLLGLFGSGTDNLDISWLNKHNICAWNHPDYIADAVAEHAIGLALSLLRRIPEADSFVKSGEWSTIPVRKLLGESLVGIQAGILGLGRIGARLARLLWAHGAKTPILYWSRRPKPEAERIIPLKYTSLEDLFSRSKIVFVTIALTRETERLVGRKLLSLMSKGYLVNVARGQVVDHDALIWALKEEHLEGVALDVYPEEPYKPPRELLEAGRLVLTPHIAGYTRRAMEDTMEWLVEELDRVAKGGKPKYPITSC